TETIQPNDTPLAGEVIEDEDVPLAGLPNTGSKGGNALLFAGMAAIVMAGAAVLVIRRRNAESK
ncbi:MAG: LPXTG cell wall anchor domain-containing protein, partial [Clostridia bacterium]|nr:LPXTG cell wall anchor domain-containing protein [Clostridia bacterium]